MEPSTTEEIPLSQRRQRKSKNRPRTIAGRRLSRAEIEEGIRLADEMWYDKPKVRSECVDGPRPCPYVSCKYHLYIDVNQSTGSIKINFPDQEVWDLKHSCALDVASQGGSTLEEVGEILNLTRERIRQVEVNGLLQLKEKHPDALNTFLPREG